MLNRNQNVSFCGTSGTVVTTVVLKLQVNNWQVVWCEVVGICKQSVLHKIKLLRDI